MNTYDFDFVDGSSRVFEADTISLDGDCYTLVNRRKVQTANPEIDLVASVPKRNVICVRLLA